MRKGLVYHKVEHSRVKKGGEERSKEKSTK